MERENTLRQHRYQQQRTAGPNSMQTGSLKQKNMKNGSPRLRADARQQFRTDAAFFESYRRVCWQKLNGRVKRLLHLK